MARRIHVTDLHPGTIALSPDQAHHLRDVLRLHAGDAVELFDDAGATADAVIIECDDHRVVVRVEAVRREAMDTSVRLTVAAAIPKGERADWMVEKLSELGVYAFVPVSAARSVVLPQGGNKRDRWMRLATESAKQSRRAGGVMRIESLTPLDKAIYNASREASHARSRWPEGPPSPSVAAWFLSTSPGARPIADLLAPPTASVKCDLTIFVGPEGGWTDDEMRQFAEHDIVPVALTKSVLRIETAAIAAAAVVLSVGFSFNLHSII